jgi:hypothetical protein
MDDIEVGSEKERDRDRDKWGMVYDLSAAASTKTRIGELHEDGGGEASEHGNGRRGREKTKGEWIIMTMCDDTGMSFRALAFEPLPAVVF